MPISPLTLRRVDHSDRPVLERLWLMFRHDLSEFSGVLPNPDGRFRDERLQTALDAPGWAAYLLTDDHRPAGFALVRGLDRPVTGLSSFFVVRGRRRGGLGLRAVAELVHGRPGPWEVAFQDANPAAARFWRAVATELAGDAWAEEHRPVPHRPDLPPDTWITFEPRVSSASAGETSLVDLDSPAEPEQTPG